MEGGGLRGGGRTRLRWDERGARRGWRGPAHLPGLVGGAGLRQAAGDDRSEPQRWPGGVAQLDSSPLSHERLARHGPVDEHAVTALAPHRPPGRGGGHLEVSAGDEGVDDLNVAVR